MTTATIICDGGLDLVSPPTEAAPGTLRACTNYEVANRRGYRPIDGIRAYSGGVINGVDNPYIIYHLSDLGNATLSNANTIAEGDTLTWGSGGTFRLSDGTLATYDGRAVVCFLRTVSSTQGVVGIAGIEGRIPSIGDEVTGPLGQKLTMTAPVITAEEAVSTNGVTNLVPGYPDNVDGATRLISLFPLSNQSLQVHAAGIPSSPKGYLAGGFYWRDRLHIVADIDTWNFTTGTVEPAVGDEMVIGIIGIPGYNHYGTVERVITTSGSWSAGTAAGTIWLNARTAASIMDPILVKEQSGGLFLDNNTKFMPGVLKITTRARPAAAMLWKDTGVYDRTGWTRCDLGHEVRFKTGINVPTILNRANRDPELETTVSYTPSATTWGPGASSAGTGWTNPGNATGAPNANVATASLNGVSPVLSITNFGFALPESAVVLGVEARITRGVGAGVINGRDFLVDLVGISGTSQNKAKTDLWSNGSLSSVTYGSASDCWGANLTASVVNGTGFGVRIRGEAVGGSGGQFQVDSIELRITYKDRSSILYFYDTVNLTDASTGRLIWYYKDKGEWADGDAQGVMTVYSLSAATAIKDGMQIRTAASGGGTLVALCGSTADKVYLEASPALDANDSQYEFAIGNFFANANAEQVFGVSGAGLAFSWDGTYCIRIRTGVEVNSDKPRHVAKHLTQLALGYASGSVMLSDVGYAESFSGVVGGSSPVSDSDAGFAGGAAEIAVGDPIYGLLPLPDQSLGVFCRRSIQRISGSGSSVASTVIEPSSGIIEYTLANIGIPVFCDFRGVGTVQATDAFGDFARGRLSDPVAPFLVPRLQDSGGSLGTNRGVVRAEVVRAKNQYRMYFRDGAVLTMTMTGNGFDRPQFTTQQLPFVVTMTCSGVSSGGRDLVFLGTYGHADVGSTDNDLKTAYEALPAYGLPQYSYPPNFVYQSDVGVTWDAALPITRSFELNGGAVGQDWLKKKLDRIVVSGLKYGFAPFGVTVGVNYGDLESTVANINAGSTTATNIKAFSEQPFSVVKSIGRDGYAFSLEIVSNGDALYGATSTQTSPYLFRPHTIQSVTAILEQQGIRR